MPSSIINLEEGSEILDLGMESHLDGMQTNVFARDQDVSNADQFVDLVADAAIDTDARLDSALSPDAEVRDAGNLDMEVVSPPDAMITSIEPPQRRIPGLPLLHDFSGAEPERVNELVRRAIDGLGLSTRTAPNERDRIFIGRSYMVWLDEAGFYGKMNGL